MVNETEEQQIAELKRWWSENGTSIVIGICLGLALVFGGRSWLAYQGAQAERASTIYTSLVQGMDSNDMMLVRERASVLMSEHASSTYAAFAALALAKISTAEKNLDTAASQLTWILENGDEGPVMDIARLRLARMMLARDLPDEAEALLQASRSSTAFDNLFHEVEGDLHSARGDAAAANAAYQRALAAMPTSAPGYKLLQLKSSTMQAASSMTSEVSP